ncbi:MAG TPA: 3-deoxy-7-phosphoheptulonate synthase, partial [Nodosilinea sp.]|nr:3-deoxy-7-phosphoheptulonate synthase [Nodosilinea sp.]
MKDAVLTRKSSSKHRSIVALTDAVSVGGDTLLIVGGPCAVESAEQMEQVARHLAPSPVQALRGGVFKPRTSPYAFQGMGEAGLRILDDIRQRFQMPVISEVMAIDQIAIMADYVDVL